MKTTLLLFGLLALSCAPEPLEQDRYNLRTFELIWRTSFEDNSLSVYNTETLDTIYKSKTQGVHCFDIERGKKYHIDIRQDKLTNTARKYTEVLLLDAQNGDTIQHTVSEKCLKNWGFYTNGKY